MSHEEYKEMVALEAAGGLRGDESRLLSDHLAACDGCRAELEELRAVAATLAYTVAPVEPSPELRARLLASVRGLRQPAFEGRPAETEEARQPAARPAGRAGDSPGRPTAVSAWRLLWGAPALRYGALATAAAVLVLCVALASAWRQAAELRAEVARMSRSLQEAQFEASRGGEEMARMREAVEFISAAESLVASLNGTDASPLSRAKLVYDEREGRALLFVSGLPPAPPGKAYQLWYVVGDRPLPGGVFTPGAAGEALLRDRIPEGGRAAGAFAVTLEPAGGVSAPTGDKYLLGAAS
ncbi:MAG TPA: anti-sigma factor [Pyrinomonadaceae bacterium]|nr:anti-sigma factor [Pyrinomonadaceae bacterium]